MSNYSSFWFDRKSSVDDILGYDLDTGIILDEKPKPKKDHVALAGHKRAIGNFVRIVSGESVPVKFVGRGDSHTDGKSVTISSTINERNFFFGDETIKKIPLLHKNYLKKNKSNILN